MNYDIMRDYSFQVVLLGTGILGMLAGVMGCYTMLRKESLIGDGVAHASLPGVVLAFLLFGSKNLEVLLAGALFTGGLSILCIRVIIRHTKIKLDGALAMVLSVFFGGGLVLLTISQKIPNANQAGLDTFIYGQASTMLMRDVKIVAGFAIICTVIVASFWKEFKLIVFDKEYAYTIGLPVGRLEILLTLMIVGTIVIGLQSVGVILVSAMMIAPAVGAKQWVKNLGGMTILSATFGMMSALLGTYTSAINEGIPTGPTIVVYSSLIAIVSIFIKLKTQISIRYTVKRKYKQISRLNK